jgi:hypothetical protein
MASYIGTAGSDPGDLRSDSKIGMGLDPSAKLDIVAPGDENSPVIRLRQSNNTAYGIDLGIDNDTNGGLFFRTNNAGSYANAMVITRDKGYVGIGPDAIDPYGLLQLNKSYIVAPAPTGDKAIDHANIMNAVKAVYNYISGADDGPHKSGTVYLQAGKYCIGDTLDFNDAGTGDIYAYGLKFIGAGKETTIIEMDHPSSEIAIIKVSAFGVTIKDLSIEAKHSDQSKQHIGIKFCGSGGTNKTSCRNSVENVRIDDVNIGILLTGLGIAESSAHCNIFRQVNIYACVTGVQVGESGTDNQSNGNQFFGCGTGDCDQYGVRFVNGSSNQLCGFDIEQCGRAGDAYAAGVRFECDKGNSMVGCYLEYYVNGSSYHPSLVRLDSKNNTITNCYFFNGNASDFLSIPSGVFGNVLSGNTFDSFSGFTDETTLWLGDQYQQIRGEIWKGLIFQTFWENTDRDAFRWTAKEPPPPNGNSSIHELMTLKAYTGRLGIGTTDPDHRLAVSDTAAGTVRQAIFGQGKTTGRSEVCIGEKADTSKSLVLGYDHGGNYGAIHVFGDDFGSGFVVKTGGFAGGYVGIGTTSPDHKLSVRDTLIDTGQDRSSGNSQICIGEEAADDKSLVVGYNRSSNYASIHLYGDAYGSALVIKDGGAVGIGTTNPGEKLEVNGGVKIGDTSNTNAGTLRFHNGALQVYQSGGWKTVTVS